VRSSDAAAALRDRFDGVGPDVYVDFSGQTASIDLGLDVIAPGGRMMLYGVYRVPASVDWNVVAEFKELEIRGGHLAPTEFGMALALLARRVVDGRRLVTARHELADVQSALDEPRGEALKTILLPGRAAPATLAGTKSMGGERTR
jgi:L-iditol 2-dehydrogenase